MAAAYTVGVVRNHPFLDGNKRTGFVVGVLFLETNGCRFTAPEEDATRAVMDLAAGLIEEKGFVAWLKNHVKVRRKPRSK
jgi:death-on-curing protein